MRKSLNVNEINSHIDELAPFLYKFREDLHRNPELSWKEFKTTEKIEKILKEHGIKDFQKPLETGGFVDLKKSDNAQYFLFRGDIDALPIKDLKAKAYASQNPGVCHACGHDVHTTIIIGLAILFKKFDIKLPFNLRLVFQPAEEPIPGGAREMIKHGILKNVKYAFGIHVDPRIPVNTISLTDGWVNMQSNRLSLELKGPGGHSAYPHKTKDLIWIATKIIQDSFHIINREFDNLHHPIILTFTEINCGEGYNIIAAKLNMTATLRLSDPKVKNQFYKRFKQHLATYEDRSNFNIKLDISEGAPAVFNEPELIDKLRMNAHLDDLKHFKVNKDFRTPGGDDFGHYSEKVKSALIRIGTKKDGFTGGLHTGHFDVPNEAILNSVSFLVHQILKF
jgi:amidohydrolase